MTTEFVQVISKEAVASNYGYHQLQVEDIVSPFISLSLLYLDLQWGERTLQFCSVLSLSTFFAFSLLMNVCIILLMLGFVIGSHSVQPCVTVVVPLFPSVSAT